MVEQHYIHMILTCNECGIEIDEFTVINGFHRFWGREYNLQFCPKCCVKYYDGQVCKGKHED
jgi:hypothetical protein